MQKIWLGIVLFVAMTAGVAAQNPAPLEGAARTQALAVAPTDRVIGKPDAPVTIVEYASLTCPHCAHFDKDVLPQIKSKWIDAGKVKLVFRDFPLDEEAVRAAQLARCAPADRFFAFVDMLFGTQEQWVGVSDFEAELARLAKLGGVGSQEFKTCLDDKAGENRVLASRLTGAQLGVDATPTFFVDGTKFNGAPTFEAFDQLLASLASKS